MSDDDPEQPRTPDEEERDRRTANIFLLCAAATLIGIGVWLVDAMLEARRADECMTQGRRNCAPIDVR
jgi:hypothetical protein